MTWLFNNTKGNLLIFMLAHGSTDTFGATLAQIFPTHVVTGSFVPLMIGFGAVALLLFALNR
jgi:hypothetical protein